MHAPSAFAFSVRAATPADAPNIAAQRLQLLAGDGDAPPGSAELAASTEHTIARLLAEGRAGAWLAVDAEGVPVGSTVLLHVDRLPSLQNRSPSEGYLAQLHVAPEWRWRGVGRALLQAALAEARARELGRVRLHATVEALGFYERAGFTARSNDLELML